MRSNNLMIRLNGNAPLFVKIPCDCDRVVPYFENSWNGQACTHDSDINTRGVDICGLRFFLVFWFIACRIPAQRKPIPVSIIKYSKHER